MFLNNMIKEIVDSFNSEMIQLRSTMDTDKDKIRIKYNNLYQIKIEEYMPRIFHELYKYYKIDEKLGVISICTINHIFQSIEQEYINNHKLIYENISTFENRVKYVCEKFNDCINELRDKKTLEDKNNEFKI